MPTKTNIVAIWQAWTREVKGYHSDIWWKKYYSCLIRISPTAAAGSRTEDKAQFWE